MSVVEQFSERMQTNLTTHAILFGKAADNPFIGICRGFYRRGIGSFSESFTDKANRELLSRDNIVSCVLRSASGKTERQANHRRIVRDLGGE